LHLAKHDDPFFLPLPKPRKHSKSSPVLDKTTVCGSCTLPFETGKPKTELTVMNEGDNIATENAGEPAEIIMDASASEPAVSAPDSVRFCSPS
jgi:hypothetical protein